MHTTVAHTRVDNYRRQGETSHLYSTLMTLGWLLTCTSFRGRQAYSSSHGGAAAACWFGAELRAGGRRGGVQPLEPDSPGFNPPIGTCF